MLNDNRLLKLRDKFLKRSKSTAGLLITKEAASPVDESAEVHQNKENESPPERPRMISPHRTRVKMGTRAIASAQFPNKSCDNIYDTIQQVTTSARVEAAASDVASRNGSWTDAQRSLYSDMDTSNDEDDDDDLAEMSLKSASLNSFCGSDRNTERVCGGGEAYVIRKFKLIVNQYRIF